jgi:hypothetical protein
MPAPTCVDSPSTSARVRRRACRSSLSLVLRISHPRRLASTALLVCTPAGDGLIGYGRAMPTEWVTPVGSLLSREQRMAMYGGAKYGGIEPSASTPNVFVYSDPARGKAYGYNFDGWDPDHDVFLYTGEGRRGDQVMRDGNRAILDHQGDQRALRLFVADGRITGTAAKNHRYLGEFEIDSDPPYTTEDAPPEGGRPGGELRTVFVFRLRPIGDFLRRAEDASTNSDAPTSSQATPVPLESAGALSFSVAGTPGTEAQRRETELAERYRTHLTSLGHTVFRWKLKLAGQISELHTDLYDDHDNELYEAKGTATRDAVRHAIGQLLDYRRHVPRDALKLAVLLPHRPSEDLVDLINGLGISCIYEQPDGGFDRQTPQSWSP